MLTLPDAIISVLQPFSTLFRDRTWSKAQLLLVGAILAPRKRTVTSALPVMGLSDDAGFAKYHQVLNRAVWSPLQMSRVLLIPNPPKSRGISAGAWVKDAARWRCGYDADAGAF